MGLGCQYSEFVLGPCQICIMQSSVVLLVTLTAMIEPFSLNTIYMIVRLELVIRNENYTVITLENARPECVWIWQRMLNL